MLILPRSNDAQQLFDGGRLSRSRACRFQAREQRVSMAVAECPGENSYFEVDELDVGIFEVPLGLFAERKYRAFAKHNGIGVDGCPVRVDLDQRQAVS